MSHILLHRVYYPVTTLGPGCRLGIWVQGCDRDCPGCLSPEMQPRTGNPTEVCEVLRRIPDDMHPDGLTISGGEPFDQPQAVAEIAEWFASRYGEDILVYTGYTLQELRARRDPHTDRLLERVAALVDGPYMQDRNNGRGLAGSNNQRLYLYRCADRYRDACALPRRLQAAGQGNRLLLIGIPPKDTKGEG